MSHSCAPISMCIRLSSPASGCDPTCAQPCGQFKWIRQTDGQRDRDAHILTGMYRKIEEEFVKLKQAATKQLEPDEMSRSLVKLLALVSSLLYSALLYLSRCRVTSRFSLVQFGSGWMIIKPEVDHDPRVQLAKSIWAHKMALQLKGATLISAGHRLNLPSIGPDAAVNRLFGAIWGPSKLEARPKSARLKSFIFFRELLRGRNQRWLIIINGYRETIRLVW